MIWLIRFISCMIAAFLGSLYTRWEMNQRIEELKTQLDDSVDKELLVYEIHRLMMPDGYKGRERDQARFWNSALKAIESFVREH